MASKYIQLMEEYKLARIKGDDKKANDLFKAAREELRSGGVSDDEALAAGYM